jgi:hypothetical protein
VLAGGAWLLWRESDELAAAADDLSVPRLLASGVVALVGAMLFKRSWFALLRGLGVTVGQREATAVFFISQLGKYLPGSVWPVLAQMRFGSRWGVPRRLMFAANMLLIAAIVATGVAVGALLLPWSSPDGLTRYWWLLLLLPPLAVVLHPRMLPTLLDRLLERVGREPTGARLSGRGLAASLAWSVAAWIVFGCHVLLLTSAYEPPEVAAVAAAIGGIALGWAAGIAFIPAPAGAGVRDVVLTLTLAPLIGTAPALVVALASRVVILVVDVLLAAAGALSDRVLAKAATAATGPRSAPDRATSA